MEKELLNTFDKELLLKDLCARLPYGVRCKLIYNNSSINDEDVTLYGIDKHGVFLFAEFGEDTRKFICKPYLFPLSSMSEEQKLEFTIVQSQRFTRLYPYPSQCSKVLDWLNKNHFDYRGLIDKSLALDATNKNIY